MGLCRRAGKMTIGCDPVVDEVKNGNAVLVLLASDISPRTERNFCEQISDSEIKIIKTSYDKEQISSALGKLSAVISINDKGFAKKILEFTGNE